MAQLQESLTRDLEFITIKPGKYRFRISQGGIVWEESETYDDMDVCIKAGMKLLDFFHEKKPLVCVDGFPVEYVVKKNG